VHPEGLNANISCPEFSCPNIGKSANLPLVSLHYAGHDVRFREDDICATNFGQDTETTVPHGPVLGPLHELENGEFRTCRTISGVNCTLSSVSTRVSASSMPSPVPCDPSPDCAVIVARDESRVSPSAAILVRVLETTWEKSDTATVSHGHPRRSFDIRGSPGTCLMGWVPDMTTEPMVRMLLRRGVDCTFSELSYCDYIFPTACKARYKLRLARRARYLLQFAST